MKVVCDANVIIDLSKIRRLDLLKDLFDEVLIPDEVREELIAGEEGGIEDADIKKAVSEWISVKEVEDRFALENMKAHIDKGESACIVLCKEIDADLLAINDLKQNSFMTMKVIFDDIKKTLPLYGASPNEPLTHKWG